MARWLHIGKVTNLSRDVLFGKVDANPLFVGRGVKFNLLVAASRPILCSSALIAHYFKNKELITNLNNPKKSGII